jgi:uncharacterized zinc-type alcohol dehydrogenase-like protein
MSARTIRLLGSTAVISAGLIAAATAADPIKLGVIVPTSGGGASVGLPIVDGIKLAVQEINAAGGINGSMIEIVVRDEFVLKISEKLDPAAAAPLLCAGITSWSPLKHWAVSKGDKVGVIGLGGLGHMGIKFAVALGAEVVMITTSPEKGADARRLGVSEVLLSNDREQMKSHRGSFDFLLNTVPVKHDLNPYLGLLARNGTMVIVGAIEPLEPMHGGILLANRRSVAGSGIGGIAETQEMLDFCAEHSIVCDIEMVDMKDVNAAYDRVVKGDVKYRFVIDMATL